ncbi:unnamed protein product, partial [Adineta steineri]
MYRSEVTKDYGYIKFGENDIDTDTCLSQYIRLAFQTNATTVVKFLKSGWRWPTPDLIISVTADGIQYQMSTHLRRIFQRGLVISATATNAWLITTGTNAGVVKLVESNHTHFLLFDGKLSNTDSLLLQPAKTEQYSRRINTNISTENALIPIVMILVEGGPFSVRTICHALQSNTPLVVVKGFGRAADLVAELHNFFSEIEIDENQTKYQVSSSNKAKLDSILEQTRINNNLWIDEVKDNLCQVLYKQKQLVAIFEFDNPRHGEKLEDAILEALLNDYGALLKKLTLNDLEELYSYSDIASGLPLEDENEGKLSTRNAYYSCYFPDNPNNQFFSPLIAAQIYRQACSMALHSATRERYENNAIQFDKYATEIIDQCFLSDENFAVNLLKQSAIGFDNIDPLHVAKEASCQSFLASDCVQRYLDHKCYVIVIDYFPLNITHHKVIELKNLELPIKEIILHICTWNLIIEELRQIEFYKKTMASNNPSIKWSVRITPLPPSMDSARLYQEFLSPRTLQISVPEAFNNNSNNRCAWISGFVNEEDANEFVRQWTGALIQGQKIKCTMSPRPNDQADSHTIPKQLTPIIEPLSNQQSNSRPATALKPKRENLNGSAKSAYSLSVNINQGSSITTNDEVKNHPDRSRYIFRTQQKPELMFQQTTTTAGLNVLSTTNFMKKQDDQDKRPLCHFAKKGICRKKSNECNYRHQRCINYKSCENSSCNLAHAKERITKLTEHFEENLPKQDLRRMRRDSSSSTSSLSSTSFTDTTTKQCRYDIKCFNVDCTFNHPGGWNPCIDGEQCDDYDCTANHPFKRKGKCLSDSNCKNADCKHLHPKTRATMCQLRGKCKLWNCQKLHPHTRTRRCPIKEKCANLECLCLHPQERSNLLCPLGGECREISCKLNHPSERPSTCDQPDICPNFNCTRLHQSQWNPCDEGDDCEDQQCPKIHSPERNLNLQQKNKKNQQSKKKNTKSLVQRFYEREKASLPIFSCREIFCQRLEREHIIIVTAETGSGKSTQLPQYAAEHFGSLVVCTQPRVVAALSLARRVAEEYDGKSVGNSVGYQVGSGNRVVGSDIMFMTDAALIRESQRDPDLKHIRVLIVDEAHERSLNTDIVIGISKLLLSKRPNDFYVVIASATIDPIRFLQFFDRSTSIPLKVEGRVFEVTTAEKPPPPNCSDQKLIISHIVPSIIELYPQHEGHTLVFLPGQSEIERALKIFKSKLPDDCIPLSLYGSQSPEDQEKVIKFNEKDKRMIVFCTNVAETSLTIPNVRLVIDSGLAKEARYDIKRRLTVIETVRISLSSADQRKGRAGRTARGHCVRLYEDNELKRQNIEPEILRSSLDLVLLQLTRLNFNPKTFPFMDQPPSDTIHNSLDLLTKLQCINEQKITKRGELFTELGLDPRLSSFIIDVYMEYKTLLELVVAIVAILSAPGTIFFMGGNREEARARVAEQAQRHKSDLIHLYLVYNAWKNESGNELQGKCSKCLKLIKYCICRIKYSNAKSLNNKILQHIYTSCLSIMKQIRNARWLQPRDEMSEDTNKILGIHLAKLFPEQCGYLLVPELPIEGVRLVSTDIRANITNTSVFMQKLNKDSDRKIYQYFVAMTITQLPSGSYITERLHPISRSEVAIQSSIQNLIPIECIGSEFASLLCEKLKAYQSESWAKWIVYQYDRTQCRFMISGPETTKSTILPVVQRCQNEIMKKLSEVYDLLECGPIKAKFQSGLVCTRINEMSSVLKMNLQNVPCQTTNELKDWIKKMMGIEWNEIKEHGFYPDKNTNNKHVYIVFKSEDTYRCAISKISSSYLIEQENQFGRSRENEKESWGRELVIQVPSNITADDIIQRYGNDSIMKCILINEKKDKFVKLDNLPITIDETYLRQCLQTNNGPTPKHVRVGRTTNNLTGWAKITFQNETERNAAASRYELELCQTSFPITIPGRKGLPKLIQTKVMKTDESDTAENLPKNFFRIGLINREAALKIYTSSQTATNSDWIVDGSATITILRTDLYPNFQQILDGICEKFKVQVKCKDIPKTSGKRCIFNHGSPQKTSLAASMLSQNFAPINIKLNTERQKQLFRELEEIGQIHKWARELSLQIN